MTCLWIPRFRLMTYMWQHSMGQHQKAVAGLMFLTPATRTGVGVQTQASAS